MEPYYFIVLFVKNDRTDLIAALLLNIVGVPNLLLKIMLILSRILDLSLSNIKI